MPRNIIGDIFNQLTPLWSTLGLPERLCTVAIRSERPKRPEQQLLLAWVPEQVQQPEQQPEQQQQVRLLLARKQQVRKQQVPLHHLSYKQSPQRLTQRQQCPQEIFCLTN